MQQQVMKYMMFFMALMFFKVPCGLCLYFIASSLWGIAERLWLPHSLPASATSAVVAATDSGGGRMIKMPFTRFGSKEPAVPAGDAARQKRLDRKKQK